MTINMEKPRPVIKPIHYSKDRLKVMQQKLAQPNLSDYQKRDYFRRLAGGSCAICQGMPTKMLTYDMNGISLIEKYCDACIEKAMLG